MIIYEIEMYSVVLVLLLPLLLLVNYFFVWASLFLYSLKHVVIVIVRIYLYTWVDSITVAEAHTISSALIRSMEMSNITNEHTPKATTTSTSNVQQARKEERMKRNKASFFMLLAIVHMLFASVFELRSDAGIKSQPSKFDKLIIQFKYVERCNCSLSLSLSVELPALAKSQLDAWNHHTSYKLFDWSTTFHLDLIRFFLSHCIYV